MIPLAESNDRLTNNSVPNRCAAAEDQDQPEQFPVSDVQGRGSIQSSRYGDVSDGIKQDEGLDDSIIRVLRSRSRSGKGGVLVEEEGYCCMWVRGEVEAKAQENGGDCRGCDSSPDWYSRAWLGMHSWSWFGGKGSLLVLRSFRSETEVSMFDVQTDRTLNGSQTDILYLSSCYIFPLCPFLKRRAVGKRST